MRHGDELDIERADREAAAERHDLNREALGAPGSLERFDFSISAVKGVA